MACISSGQCCLIPIMYGGIMAHVYLCSIFQIDNVRDNTVLEKKKYI